MKKVGPSKRRSKKAKTCPFPDKNKYTQEEAFQLAKTKQLRQHINVVSYKCPAGGHSHIGHKSPFQEKRDINLRNRS